MQRSTTTEATFITTSAGQRAIRTVASFVAVALVGTTPWMVSNSTLAQDAPATEPAPAPAPAQDDAAEQVERQRPVSGDNVVDERATDREDVRDHARASPGRPSPSASRAIAK